MARRSAGGSKILPMLLLLGVWAVIVGLRASFVVLFVVLVVAFLVVSRARPKGTASSARSTYGTDRKAPDLEAAEGFDRLARLAAELAIPGGRPRAEVMDEATAVYAQLPPYVREEIHRRAPEGWFGTSAPGTVAPWDANPTWPGAPTPHPTPAPTPVPTPVPTVVQPTVVESVVPEPAEPVPGGDVRYSVLAPDELTGDPSTPPGAVAEGWYITADRTRERWHNGSSWTAHVRVRGRG